MARNSQRGSRNNNPEGRNQYNSGWMDTAKERPMATAAAAAAAVGAGVFLWSRRNQISEQISSLSEQFTDWTSSQQYSGSDGEFEMADAGSSTMSSGSSGSSTSASRGGGNRSRGRGGSQGMSASTGSTGSTGGTTGSGGNL